MRLSVNVTITVLGTLLIAAIGYGGMAAAQSRRTAAAEPVPPATPGPLAAPLPTHVYEPVVQHVVWDADVVDQATAWLLLSDCESATPATCHYSVKRTTDGGGTWSPAVLVGPLFSSGDGDAPRTIRFLDRINGFVYGHSVAFETHDAGGTWADAGFKGEIVGIAPFESTVWAVTRPCAKGVTCPYEVRSSHDGGATWSQPHQLPVGFAPETVVAFGSGAILSGPPPEVVVLTADGGVTWHELKSPCGADDFRGRATSADGIEIWVLCQQLAASTGAINDATIFVSTNAGQTWTRRGVPGSLPAWIVSPKVNVAVADGEGSMVLSTDSGATWSRVSAGDARFEFARFLSPELGWAMDANREVWITADSGTSWLNAMSLPNTQP